MQVEKGEGLLLKGECFDNKNTNRRKFKRHKYDKCCKYCRKRGHLVDDYYNLKNKREKDERNKKIAKASIVEYPAEEARRVQVILYW